MSKEELNKTLNEIFEQNKEEFQKGLEMGFSWGIEAYSIDKETGKLKTLTLEEALELKDNPNYEVVSIQDHSPEEVMKQFAKHLTLEELESLTKPVLRVPSDATWNEDKWLEYSKFQPLILNNGEETDKFKAEYPLTPDECIKKD